MRRLRVSSGSGKGNGSKHTVLLYRGRSSRVHEHRFALEDIPIAAGIPRFRIGMRDAEDVAEVVEEGVFVRAL